MPSGGGGGLFTSGRGEVGGLTGNVGVTSADYGLACWTLVPASVSVEALEVGRGGREEKGGSASTLVGLKGGPGGSGGGAASACGLGGGLSVLVSQATVERDGSGTGGERGKRMGEWGLRRSTLDFSITPCS